MTLKWTVLTCKCVFSQSLHVCMFSPPCSVWSSMSDQQWRLQSPVSALTWRRLQVFLSHRLLLVSWQQAVHVQLHCQPGGSPQLHLCYSVWLYVCCWYITDSKHNPVSLPSVCLSEWHVPSILMEMWPSGWLWGPLRWICWLLWVETETLQ